MIIKLRTPNGVMFFDLAYIEREAGKVVIDRYEGYRYTALPIRQVKGIMKCIRRYMDEDTRKRVIAFVETSENAKFRRAWADTDPERKKRVCC